MRPFVSVTLAAALAAPLGAQQLFGLGMVLNVPIEYDEMGRPDGYLIRRQAVDAGVQLITDLQLARAVIEALRWRKPKDLNILSWNDYLARDKRLLV